ncbi:MAG: hypothetical protein JNL03_08500, partial [Prolixibacteraceae bacterium]|nr:hypothetical protein [Prolixibacteraceae bacterium]
DKEADPIDEVMKKYAIEAIRVATFNGYNELGVIDEFERKEGFSALRSEYGIELISVSEYQFDEEKLTVEIENLEANDNA